MTDYTRVYWDTCCWIGLIAEEESKIAGLRNVLGRAQRGDLKIFTSALSRAEVVRLVKPDKNVTFLTKNGMPEFESLLRQDFIVVVNLDLPIATRASELFDKGQPKKLADAIHAATAAEHDLDVLQTYDRKDLVSISGKILKKNGEPLIIEVPADDLPLMQAAANAANDD